MKKWNSYQIMVLLSVIITMEQIGLWEELEVRMAMVLFGEEGMVLVGDANKVILLK